MQSLDDVKRTLLRRHVKVPHKELSPCWVWTGAVSKVGYGNIKVNGRNYSTHALSYQIWRGMPFPTLNENRQLDHLCAVRACINPDHLESVTRAVNVLRGRNPNSQKTHCPKGHPYDEANTYWRLDPGHMYGRECRLCRTLHRIKFKKKTRSL